MKIILAISDKPVIMPVNPRIAAMTVIIRKNTDERDI